MKKHLSKKRVVLAAIVAVVLAISSGIAYAYWSSTGSGSNTASVASTAPGFTVTVGAISGSLVPGGSVNISGSVSNPNDTKLNLTTIAQAATPISIDALHSPGCLATDFTISALSPTPALPKVLAKTESVTFTGTLSMANTALDQNACKGATVTVNIAAS
jgi:hypothetical protein